MLELSRLGIVTSLVCSAGCALWHERDRAEPEARGDAGVAIHPVDGADAGSAGQDAGIVVDVADAGGPAWEPPSCEAPFPNATILGNTPAGPVELSYVYVGDVFGGSHDCLDIHLAFSTAPRLEAGWDEAPRWGPGDVLELTMYAGEADLTLHAALPVHAILHHGSEQMAAEGTVTLDSFDDEVTAASGHIAVHGPGWSVTGSFAGDRCSLLADTCI